jgi:hypothetical protein
MFKIPNIIAKPFKNVPLKAVLVIPFVIEICLATGLIWGFTFHNGKQTVEIMAESLSGEISDRISSELSNVSSG